MKVLTRILVLSLGLLLGVFSPVARASTWTGGSGNWSSDGSPGWNGTGVPDAQGALATKADGVAATVAVDILARTIGTLTYGGSTGGGSWTFTLTNALILDQDGPGAGTATISNTSTSANTTRISIGSGTVTLQDNLLISNSGASTSTGGSIITGSGTVIGGSGNLTLSNVSNDIGVAQITLGGNSTFNGIVAIQKGAVTFSGNTGFGNSSNAVNLGSSGNSTTLVSTGTSTNLANGITVASTAGTNILGSTSTASSSDSTFGGTLTLTGDLTVTSAKIGTASVLYSNTISGAGALTVGGSTLANTRTTLKGNNTFTGDTRIVSGTLSIGALSGTDSQALAKSTVDLNASDTGTLSFGTANAAGTIVSITSATLGGLTGSRDLLLQNINLTSGAVALSVGNNNTDQSYSGKLTGTGSLTKIGSGKQTLSGANTYAGATNVNAGTLIVSGSISGSTVTVNNTGTLGGGTTAIPGVVTGVVTVNNGGTLSPGSNINIGTLNTSTLDLKSNSIFALEINTTANTTDLVAINGNLNLADADDAVLTISDLAPGTPAGTALVFISYSGTWDGDLFKYDGSFIADNAPVTVGANQFTLDYNYNGNSVALIAVPEPGSVVSSIAGLALLLGLPRFRRPASPSEVAAPGTEAAEGNGAERHSRPQVARRVAPEGAGNNECSADERERGGRCLSGEPPSSSSSCPSC